MLSCGKKFETDSKNQQKPTFIIKNKCNLLINHIKNHNKYFLLENIFVKIGFIIMSQNIYYTVQENKKGETEKKKQNKFIKVSKKEHILVKSILYYGFKFYYSHIKEF